MWKDLPESPTEASIERSRNQYTDFDPTSE